MYSALFGRTIPSFSPCPTNNGADTWPKPALTSFISFRRSTTHRTGVLSYVQASSVRCATAVGLRSTYLIKYCSNRASEVFRLDRNIGAASETTPVKPSLHRQLQSEQPSHGMTDRHNFAPMNPVGRYCIIAVQHMPGPIVEAGSNHILRRRSMPRQQNRINSIAQIVQIIAEPSKLRRGPREAVYEQQLRRGQLSSSFQPKRLRCSIYAIQAPRLRLTPFRIVKAASSFLQHVKSYKKTAGVIFPCCRLFMFTRLLQSTPQSKIRRRIQPRDP